MGVSSVVAQGVAAAFSAVGDLKIAITFVRVTIGTYDPATDTNVGSTVSINIPDAVSVKQRVNEFDFTPADANKRKIIIQGSAVSGIPPTENDYVIIAGAQWEIKKVHRVPGDSVFILMVRLP